ncbi:MAG: aldehyde dehydrogenase family protein, partial [Proteobacteria bacterium]|nr:aldehyde dehydrogenase family protein [Pseudomonadota bacterium]
MLKLKDPSLLKTDNFVNGEWVAGGAGTMDVINPANGAVVATTANADATDAKRAVDVAADAFVTWSRIPAKQRAVLLRNWFNLLMENAEDLGAMMRSWMVWMWLAISGIGGFSGVIYAGAFDQESTSFLLGG